MLRPAAPAVPDRTLVLYDGVCGLCDWLVRFILARDREARFRFAALQSEAAGRALSNYGLDPGDLNTVYVIAAWQSPRERVFARSRAVFHCLTELGGVWRVFGRIGSVLPTVFAETLYRGVASVRYRIFGRFDTCVIPPAHVRRRFIDQAEAGDEREFR